jgi:phage terminase small subunit
VSVLRNSKHEHFAHLVAKGEKAGPAYVAAGYSKQGADQSAARLLRDAKVCSRIAQLREAIEKPARERAIEKAAVDKTWVLHQLIEVVKMAKAAEPVRDNDGNPTGEYRQNLAAANKALELIGKEHGMFIDRKIVATGPLDSLPTDELKQLQDALIALQASVSAEPGSTARTTH